MHDCEAGLPPRPPGIMTREWAALLMRGPDNLLLSLLLFFPSILNLSLPLTTSCPRAPRQIPAQYSSAFRPSGMSVKERYKSQAETKSVTSAKMIASKYVWQLLLTVTVVTVQEILPHFCLHWGRWAYSDSLAACQKLHSQLSYFVWICSTVGGKCLFGITINLPCINHSLVCRPFSIFYTVRSSFPPTLSSLQL